MLEENVEASAESPTPSQQAEKLGEDWGFPKVVESARRILDSAKKSDNFWAALPYSVLSEFKVQEQAAFELEIPDQLKDLVNQAKELAFPNKPGIRTALGAFAGGAALYFGHAALSKGKGPGWQGLIVYPIVGASIGNHFENV